MLENYDTEPTFAGRYLGFVDGAAIFAREVAELGHKVIDLNGTAVVTVSTHDALLRVIRATSGSVRFAYVEVTGNYNVWMES